MKRVFHLGAMTVATAGFAIMSIVACSGGDASQSAASTRAAIHHDEASEPAPLCSEDEAMSLLRLHHLRALHLAVAMRDRLKDSGLRSFGDRMVEEHMNLVNEIDAVRGSSSSSSRDGGAVGVGPGRGLASLGELTERAIRDIETAPEEDVERMYVQHQLDEHMRSIGLIDNVLLPSVGGRAQGRGQVYDVIQAGRDLFGRHVHHLYEREVALDRLCGAAVH